MTYFTSQIKEGWRMQIYASKSLSTAIGLAEEKFILFANQKQKKTITESLFLVYLNANYLPCLFVLSL